MAANTLPRVRAGKADWRGVYQRLPTQNPADKSSVWFISFNILRRTKPTFSNQKSQCNTLSSGKMIIKTYGVLKR